jgi:hypothetical protein
LAPTVLVGDKTVEAGQDEVGGGSAEAFSYTAATTGSATKLNIYVDSASSATSIQVGVYSNASGNHPGTLLASGTLTSPTKGAFNSVTIPTVSITAGQTYWIAILAPAGTGTARFRDVASGGPAESSTSTSLTALPATWSTGGTWPNSPMSAYLTP